MLKDHKFKAARASVRGGAREREWKDREKGRTLTRSQSTAATEPKRSPQDIRIE